MKTSCAAAGLVVAAATMGNMQAQGQTVTAQVNVTDDAVLYCNSVIPI